MPVRADRALVGPARGLGAASAEVRRDGVGGCGLGLVLPVWPLSAATRRQGRVLPVLPPGVALSDRVGQLRALADEADLAGLKLDGVDTTHERDRQGASAGHLLKRLKWARSGLWWRHLRSFSTSIVDVSGELDSWPAATADGASTLQKPTVADQQQGLAFDVASRLADGLDEFRQRHPAVAGVH